jgi:hypothetical protein
MSSGVPNLPFGVDSPSFSEPPPISINPCAILEGNIPGAMQFTRMFLGPSSKARFRARWMTAALDVTYECAKEGPVCTVRPPMEDVITTLEGSSIEALCWSSGANLLDV